MTAYIPEVLRREVRERARNRCEYCLIAEGYGIKPHEVDHIHAEKHGGATDSPNLCLSCLDCNRHKGTDLCSLDEETGEVISLYHPRQQRWADHFRLDGTRIEALTATGRVTLRLLAINDSERIEEREDLRQLGLYPESPQTPPE